LSFEPLLGVVETEYNLNDYFGVLFSTVLSLAAFLFKTIWIAQKYVANINLLASVFFAIREFAIQQH